MKPKTAPFPFPLGLGPDLPFMLFDDLLQILSPSTVAFVMIGGMQALEQPEDLVLAFLCRYLCHCPDRKKQ